jgi:hypothetical protein
VHAVVLPLEVQMKDHKAQLQARLDNLAKINEKTSSINEEMAKLRAVESELRKQREMIDALIERVSLHETQLVPETFLAGAAVDPEKTLAPEMLETVRMAAVDVAPAAPLVSDDLMSELNAGASAERTQRVGDGERTQQIAALDPAFRPDATQKLEAGAETTQRTDDALRRLQEAKRILQKTGK